MLPRRWAVECFFAWINRNRRLAKDFEDTASATAFLYIASILKMTGHISMLDSWAPQGSGGLLDWRHLVQSARQIGARVSRGAAPTCVLFDLHRA